MNQRVSVLSIALVAGLGSAAASAEATPKRSGKALFVQHCARCHTTSGGGLDESHPAFGNFAAPPADFTDPVFSSMEPAADWFLVVRHGGKSMGLSHQMPAHADRLTDEEIERILAYVKTIADTHCYPRGELNLLRPILTKKAFPETEFLYLGRWDHGDVDRWKSTLYYAHRMSRRWSAEAKLSHVVGGGANEVEEGDIGAKFAAYPGSRLLVTLGAEAEIPFEGDTRPIAIPYLAYATTLGEKLTLQGALDVALPLDGLDLGRARLSHAVHWLTTDWPRGLFPAIEVTGWVPFTSDAEWGASVTPQLRLSMSKRGHVSLTAGVEIPLHGAGYDWRGHTFLLWDIADGPFWEGW